MMCTDIHCEDGDEDIIMYRNQEVSTEERNKATYGKLMKTQSEQEEEIKCHVALCTNNSVTGEEKKMT